MKNSCFALFLLTLFLIACNNGDDKQILPSASGKYGEVLVVVDTLNEGSKIGSAINELFNKAMPGLPQLEPQFRMATVAPSKFKSILKRARNILKISINQESKTSIDIQNNVWAEGQLLINIIAPTPQKVVSILEKNMQTIRDYFNEEELKRLLKQYKKKPQEDLSAEIEADHFIKLTIPPAYKKMAGDLNGFWLKKEKKVGEHQIMQGLVIYHYPYDSDSTFSINEMISKRNEFCKQYIQGFKKGAYMSVFNEYEPASKSLNIDDTYVAEYRGLWNMQNDFMGGPFLHYTFIDEKRNRVINVDGFVYAPQFNKKGIPEGVRSNNEKRSN